MPKEQNAETGLLDIIKRSAGLILAIGFLLGILGILAIASPLATGLSIAVAVGLLLIAGGIGQLFFSFKAGSFGAGLLIFLLGSQRVLIGVLMVAQPVFGLASLTLLLAIYFAVEGIFEIAWAFQLKPADGWGWALFGGVASLLLGLAIWREFPLSGAWAVGVFVGIKLLFSGTTLVSLGGGVRSVAKYVQSFRE
jgi:uncharacterized membrane protein HdeD (DUF308 family)